MPVSRKGIIPINNKQTNKTTLDSFSQQAEREVTANILSVLSSSLSFFLFFFFFFLLFFHILESWSYWLSPVLTLRQTTCFY